MLSPLPVRALALLCTLSCATPPPARRGGSGPAPSVGPPEQERVAAAPAAQTVAPIGPEEKPPVLQLPGDVRPTHYALSMEIVPSRERFRGAVDIDIRLERPRTVLWLHGRDLHVSASTVAGAPAAYEQVNPEGLARLVLSRPVGPGPARVHLEWDAAFDPRIVGLYLAREAGEAYAFTQFESVDARRAFPGFDEPVFKTPFDVTLTVPASDVAIANTLPTDEAPAGDGLKRLRFATTKPLPTYLLIWAVGPFDVVAPPPLPPNEVRRRPLPVRGVAPRGRGGELATALETGAAQLALQEKYFGVPFPFEKLDHIAAPDYTYGAMENAGGILYREELLLFKPGVSSEESRRAIGSVMAHEISHQWFGDLVTLRWWTDAWLNESFATWMGTRTEEEWDPSMRAGLYLLAHGHKAMAIDALKSARAVRQPLDDVNNIWNQFDAITYEKGAMVLSMFERFVGEEKFRAGIHAYFASHAYGSGDTGELLDAFSQAAGRDVKTAFQTFLDQPGLPIVDVHASCEGEKGKLRLEQARYVPLGSDGPREGAWKIPICVRYGAAGGPKQACTLLEARAGELELDSCPEWVMPNADASGYYRWSLPAPELQELSGGAYPQLTARERMSLADNVRAAMRSGRLAFADGVPAIAAMAADPDPQVAATPLLLLKEARDHLMAPADRPHVERFARDLYRPVLRRLGWRPARGEPAPMRAFRAKLVEFLAFDVHDPQVLAEAARRGRDYAGLAEKRFHPEAVDPGLATAVLMAAVRQGGAAVYDALLARLDATPDSTTRLRILAALAAANDPGLLQRTLALTRDDRLRKNERIEVMFEVATHDESRSAAWDAYRRDFDAVVALVPEAHAATMIHVPAKMFCDPEHLAGTREFLAGRAGNVPGGTLQLAETLETMEQCVAYRDAQERSAAEFFGRKPTPDRQVRGNGGRKRVEPEQSPSAATTR